MEEDYKNRIHSSRFNAQNLMNYELARYTNEIAVDRHNIFIALWVQ